jgi:hypothetical protein
MDRGEYQRYGAALVARIEQAETALARRARTTAVACLPNDAATLGAWWADHGDGPQPLRVGAREGEKQARLGCPRVGLSGEAGRICPGTAGAAGRREVAAPRALGRAGEPPAPP